MATTKNPVAYNIDIASITEKLTRSRLPTFEEKAKRTAEIKFNNSKRQLMESFAESSITQSLLAEEDGGDAGLLDGRGSLYGFLGFVKGSENPANELGAFLENNITIDEGRKVPNAMEYKFRIKTPSEEDINQVTKLPWTLQGWVDAVTNGLSGLKRFIYWEPDATKGRSTAGLQAKNDIRDNEMNTAPDGYVFSYLRNFGESIRNKFKT